MLLCAIFSKSAKNWFLFSQNFLVRSTFWAIQLRIIHENHKETKKMILKYIFEQRKLEKPKNVKSTCNYTYQKVTSNREYNISNVCLVPFEIPMRKMWKITGQMLLYLNGYEWIQFYGSRSHFLLSSQCEFSINVQIKSTVIKRNTKILRNDVRFFSPINISKVCVLTAFKVDSKDIQTRVKTWLTAMLGKKVEKNRWQKGIK